MREHACATIVVVVLMAGCAASPSLQRDVNRAAVSSQADAAVREAKAEAAGLRADLAAARIATAKQQAELQELRRHVDELTQLADARQAELLTLREERDRLAQPVSIAQVRVADPQTSPAELSALQGKLSTMESAIATLAAEIAKIKQAMTTSASTPPRK